MDRTYPCGGYDAGSIPAERTRFLFIVISYTKDVSNIILYHKTFGVTILISIFSICEDLSIHLRDQAKIDQNIFL